MRFHREWIIQLLNEQRLFLPGTFRFNDPFDSSFDAATRMKFIECGMASFSEEKDSILLYSHYADSHKGICVGFAPKELCHSMVFSGGKGEVRRVLYFRKWPPIDPLRSPTIACTSKHDIWSYEKEWRLFVVGRGNNGHNWPLPEDAYSFGREAIKSVTFGCCASDECIALVKGIVSRYDHEVKLRLAKKREGEFGLDIVDL